MPSLKLYVRSPDLISFKALNLLCSGNETKAISKSTGQPLVQGEAENVLAAATLERPMAQTFSNREERNIFCWAN